MCGHCGTHSAVSPCYKAYSTTFERLYLYVIIATLFSEAVEALGIEHQFQYEKQAQVCFWLGFVTHWTSVMVFIYAFGIILYLLCLIVTKIRGIYVHKLYNLNAIKPY